MLPIDDALFARLFPGCPSDKRAEYLPHFIVACHEAAIVTPQRLAAFAAQLGHESGDLRWWEEIATGDAYEGRRDLGNTQPGDGRRYKGRGPIQLTGRANYRAAGAALGIDLERHPERANDPDVGFRVAAWYWSTRGLNELADVGDFTGITRRINGGLNGQADRVARLHRAVQALGGVM
jgi:putative chitinase